MKETWCVWIESMHFKWIWNENKNEPKYVKANAKIDEKERCKKTHTIKNGPNV